MKHLSRFDIEAIADKYVQAYMALPDVRNTQIYRIDPELLLEKVQTGQIWSSSGRGITHHQYR